MYQFDTEVTSLGDEYFGTGYDYLFRRISAIIEEVYKGETYNKDINALHDRICWNRMWQSEPCPSYDKIKDIIAIYGALVNDEEKPIEEYQIADAGKKYQVEQAVIKKYGSSKDVETVMWDLFNATADGTVTDTRFLHPKLWILSEKDRTRPENSIDKSYEEARSGLSNTLSDVLFYGKIFLIVGGGFFILNKSGLIDKSVGLYKSRKK